MGRLIQFVFLILILVSCKKGTGEFVIKGTVKDLTFNQGLNGGVVEIYKVPIGTLTEVFISSKTLDASGNYEFKVPRDKSEKYVIRVLKANYFPIKQDLFYSSLSIATDNIRNLETHAQAWVKIQLKKSNPQSTNYLRYIKQEGLQGCETCCPSTEQNFYGATDTTFYCINNGNQSYSFYYWVIGTTNQGLREIITTPFDTVSLNLLY